jgi:DNA-binding LacI/PurR family transcriptional regulator
MLYVHWDDPTLQEALDGYDGVFLNPSSEPIPPRIVERLQRSGRRLVVLGRDLTVLGVPSVDLFPSIVIQQLLDHLAELGHKVIDCFNVQTVDPVIEERIKQWNLWRAAHRMQGRLINEPIRPYVEATLVHAFERFGQLLDEGAWRSTALLCTTAPAAIGAIRAMRDRGIHVGQDVSVCVVNDEGLGRFMSPSLTSIEMPDPEPYLAVCMEWMQSTTTGWVGPLLLQPSNVPIFLGESTGRAPVATTTQTTTI